MSALTRKNLALVSGSEVKPLQMFIEGQVDAYLALPPEPQDLHARKIWPHYRFDSA
jgi:NitT/TauT family transport system substrate-binding protein